MVCCLTALISNSQPETKTSKAPLKNQIKFCVLWICLVCIYTHTQKKPLFDVGSNVVEKGVNVPLTLEILYIKGSGP